MKSSPARPSKNSAVPAALLLPYSVSAKYEPAMALTAGEGVGADIGQIARRDAVRRAGQQIDRHAGGRVDVGNPRVAVAGDGVVAAQPLEFVEGVAATDR